MDSTFILTALNILVAFLGVAFLLFGLFEYRTLSHLRQDFDKFKAEWQAELYRIQKAQQRVMASYSLTDVDRKIALLKSAVAEDPKTFNGYNALGYAYLEKDEKEFALDAFRNAIKFNPEKKEGYFDLAMLYFELSKHDLAEEYLRQAINQDSSSKEDIKSHPKLTLLATRLGLA